MTDVMEAMVLTDHGDLDVYEFRRDFPKPTPAPGQVLLQVLACGMNNTDVNTRSGWYSKAVTEATTGGAFDDVDGDDPTWGGSPVQFPRIQGADICGRVAALGDGVNPELLGKRVINDCWLRDWDDPLNREKMGYTGSEIDGGFAQYAVIDARNLGVVTCDMTDTELATFSCSYSTAEGMLTRANVVSGDRVLVTGASGGVGSALVQLAKLRGATVIALASEHKHTAMAPLGADHLLPRAPENLRAALHAITGAEEVDVVADIVGGSYFGTVIDALARGGRYTCSGAIAGPIVELDLRTFYLRDLTFTGSTAIPPGIFEAMLGYINRKEIMPIVAAAYPLAELAKGQAEFIKKAHIGNFVVVP